MNEQVVEYKEIQKLMKPSTYSTELQQRLLLDGVVHPANLASVSQINKVIRKELVMTRKKLTSIPLESTIPEATTTIDDFLTEIANVNPATLHFFDESSVIKTTGNRNYGSAPLGQAAFCGFHHGHRIEPVLRDMLADCGIRLLFQPPYSPHFNTCEYCFHEIKAFLRRHQMLAVNETKIAIAQAMLNITANSSCAYFKHCGYFL